MCGIVKSVLSSVSAVKADIIHTIDVNKKCINKYLTLSWTKMKLFYGSTWIKYTYLTIACVNGTYAIIRRPCYDYNMSPIINNNNCNNVVFIFQHNFRINHKLSITVMKAIHIELIFAYLRLMANKLNKTLQIWDKLYVDVHFPKLT